MCGYKSFLAVAVLAVGFCTHSPHALSAPIGISACQTISTSGSYALTGNLNAAGDCITMAVDHVTLDLDGYSITGNGSGNAIKSNGVLRKNISVRNGTIQGFTNGIWFNSDGVYITVERMRFVGNSGKGVAVNEAAVVKDSVAYENGLAGISVGSRSIVTGNIALRNYDGMTIGIGSTVIGNNASQNTHHGFVIQNGSVISTNTAQANINTGFYVYCAADLVGNTATGNSTNLFLSIFTGNCVQAHNLAP